MKFRLYEGSGECIYEIGVNNNGQSIGISKEEYEESIQTIQRMAAKLNLTTFVLHERELEKMFSRICGEILIHQPPLETISCLRVAFCGATAVGKSPLLSVLVWGTRDDGCGAARQLMFRHKHERRAGETSCVAGHALRFTSDGSRLNPEETFFDSESCARIASSYLTFLHNLAGSDHYLSSCTVPGLSA